MPDWQTRQQYAFDLFADNGHKIIIARDHYYKKSDTTIPKQYATIKDADSLYDFIEQRPTIERFFYEIFHEDTPLKSTSSLICIDSELEPDKLHTNDPYKQGVSRFIFVNCLFIVRQKILREEYDVDLNMS